MRRSVIRVAVAGGALAVGGVLSSCGAAVLSTVLTMSPDIDTPTCVGGPGAWQCTAFGEVTITNQGLRPTLTPVNLVGPGVSLGTPNDCDDGPLQPGASCTYPVKIEQQGAFKGVAGDLTATGGSLSIASATFEEAAL